jgi:hypothetical protein
MKRSYVEKQISEINARSSIKRRNKYKPGKHMNHAE